MGNGNGEGETEGQRDGRTEGWRDRESRITFLSVPPSLCPSVSPSLSSVNLRLRRLGAGVQEIEVASLIGLRDMLAEERAESTLIMWRRRRPFGAPARHFFFADQQIQFSIRHVQFDQISVADEGQRPADVTFRRDVQHTGAV